MVLKMAHFRKSTGPRWVKVHIFSQSSKRNGWTENTQPHILHKNNWENWLNLRHTLNRLYLTNILYIHCLRVSLHNEIIILPFLTSTQALSADAPQLASCTWTAQLAQAHCYMSHLMPPKMEGTDQRPPWGPLSRPSYCSFQGTQRLQTRTFSWTETPFVKLPQHILECSTHQPFDKLNNYSGIFYKQII